jgi:hypothetical protein
MNREELIQRKAGVQAALARLRRQLAAAQSGGRPARQLAGLEEQIQALQAEEQRLRLQIDRSR